MTTIGEFLASRRADGMAHEGVLARYGRDEPTVVALEDLAEDNAARLAMAGYRPGSVLDAVSRAQELSVEIDAEERRIARAESASRRLMDLHAQGRISVDDLMRMQPEDEGDPARLQRLRGQLDAVGHEAVVAQGAVGSASRMAAQTWSGDDWQARRAERMQAADDDALIARYHAQRAEMTEYLVRHHTRELQRAQATEQLARQGNRRSGTGWPAEIARTARPEFDPAA